MYKRRRTRVQTHSLEDQREELFMTLKTRLEVMAEMETVYKDDPTMQV